MEQPDDTTPAAEYVNEILSPQARRVWKERFAKFSKARLKAIGELILAASDEPENREQGIAEGHFKPELRAEVKRENGKRRLQTIYCSSDRCGNCPHGPYWYCYQKRGSRIAVRYDGKPALDEETINRMKQDVVTPIAYKLNFEKDTPT